MSMASQGKLRQTVQARYEGLLRISRALCEYRDAKELFRVLADELRRFVAFNYVAIYLYDEASRRIYNPLLETLKGPQFVIPADSPLGDTITLCNRLHAVPGAKIPRLLSHAMCVNPLTLLIAGEAGLVFPAASATLTFRLASPISSSIHPGPANATQKTAIAEIHCRLRYMALPA